MDITAIAIVGIICWTIVSLVDSRKYKQKTKSIKNQDSNELHGRIDQMQARIETLEKIVTDEQYDLKRELNALSKNASTYSNRAA